MTKTEYSDANTYFKNRFGTKVYKAAISLDVTCPNRDGTKGVGGCIFCGNGGSGEFASSKVDPIKIQIDSAVSMLQKKIKKPALYIAYFQSFTNTYCSPLYLEKELMEAAGDDRICALSIGTRPDCLNDDIIEVLKRVNAVKPVMVELGLQTIHDKTAQWFNRCYETREFDDSVKRLKDNGIEVICHLIFGLKDETKEMMLQSVKHVVDLKVDGIKFTCLYVLKDTPLAELWQEGKLHILERDEYFDIVEDALKLIPKDIIIHRLTGDGPKKLLLAPSWTKDKRSVVNYINNRFEHGG